MPKATLRQRKTFALLRIIAGLVAALYLSYVLVTNLITGAPFEGALRYTALVALAGFFYAAWYLRDLAAVAREEHEEREAGGED